jgi:hypothetical protein
MTQTKEKHKAGENTQLPEGFVEAVDMMRFYQRVYFRIGSPKALADAKVWERKVDAFLVQISTGQEYLFKGGHHEE